MTEHDSADHIGDPSVFHWLLTTLALLAVEVAIARYAPPGALLGCGARLLDHLT